MPPHRLAELTDRTPARPSHPGHAALIAAVEQAAAGTPLDRIAAETGMTRADLEDAAKVYRSAGAAALSAMTDSAWYHANIQFHDWRTVEPLIVAELAPRMHHLTATGAITGWWFLRKYPCLRLRMHPSADAVPQTRDAINASLDDFGRTEPIERWWPSRYEPETFAFGGPPGLSAAHDHFCADTLGTVAYLGQQAPGIGRRELSVLLCTTMLAAAGLDWFEIGDVWNRIADLRPPASAPTPERHRRLVEQLQTLLSLGAGPANSLLQTSTSTAFAAQWARAFRHTGHTLGASAAAGTLQRGMRHVLSHLVIFHWNRLGLHTDIQAALARAGRDATLPRD
jgi:thiopeptide-type bacteriocin biosynthesis protein